MKYLLFYVLLLLSFAQTAQASENWTSENFEMPESALLDSQHNRLIVSNIKGHPGKADGNGYLSLLSPQGKVLNAHWVNGLDAPKGMAIVGNQLLVADLTILHVIDLDNGKIIASHHLEKAKFLNDITSSGNTAWISDFMNDTIWQYRDGELSIWLQSPALNHPNGLLVEKDRLLVGSWGKGMKDDFTTDTPGDLLAIDLKSKKISTLSPSLGNLDGIVALDQGYAVSDWVTGDLFTLNAKGQVLNKQYVAKGLADIGSNKNEILAPLMFDGKIVSLKSR